MDKQSPLFIKRFSEEAIIPKRQTAGSVGYDLHSIEELVIEPKQWKLVDTGVGIKLPSGTYGRVAPRSGLSVKYGIHVGAGVIDPDWRAAIKVVLFNLGDTPFRIEKHDRIAQLVLEKVCTPETIEVKDLEHTERNDQGFGSTGMK